MSKPEENHQTDLTPLWTQNEHRARIEAKSTTPYVTIIQVGWRKNLKVVTIQVGFVGVLVEANSVYAICHR